MPLISSKQVWTQQPQTRQQLNPRFSDRLIALVVPGQPEYFGGGAPVITGVGKIVPAIRGIAAKAVYTGSGSNEVRWPVNLSFSGDYTFSVFSSNEDQIADLQTFYTSGTYTNNIAHGNVISSAIIDNNGSPTITTTASYTPRLISARRRSNQCSVVVDKTASSENVTGTRDQVWTALNVGRDGASNSVGTTNYLIAVWNKYVSNEDLFALSENPWQIFKKQDRRIWIPSAGGGGVTITCTPGGATTAGVTTTFPQSISCNAGNASATGISAGISSATTISCNVGNATTAGVTAGIAGATVISCNAGNATTAGVTAGISLDASITIACNAGNATAAGVAAGISFDTSITISCNVGTATTAGVTAGISSAIVLACSAGTATTLGATAYFPQSLQCSHGNAIALGIDATFTLTGPTTIVCNVGNATASGISFSFGGTLVDATNGSGPTIIRPQTNRPPNIGGIRI